MARRDLVFSLPCIRRENGAVHTVIFVHTSLTLLSTSFMSSTQQLYRGMTLMQDGGRTWRAYGQNPSGEAMLGRVILIET